MSTEVTETPIALDASQMDAIFGATPAAEPAIEATPAPEPEVTTEEKPADLPPTEEGLDVKALEELAKLPEPETPATPAVDPYVSKVREVFPTEQHIGWAADSMVRLNRAETAAQNGDFKTLAESLPFLSTVIPTILDRYVAANEEKIVQAYIDRHDPARQQDPRVSALQQEVTGLKNVIQTAQQQNLTAQQQQQYAQQQYVQQQAVAAIDSEVTRVLDQVRFSKDETDRETVAALFKNALARDPALLQKTLANPSAARPLLAQVATKYAKAEQAKRGAAPTSTPPKPILTGAGSATSDSAEKPDRMGLRKAENYLKSLVKG